MLTGLIQASFALPVIAGVSAFFFSPQHRGSVPYALFALGGGAALTGALASLFMPTVAGALGTLPAFFYAILGAGVTLASLYAIAYVPRYKDTYALPWFAAAFAAFIIGMQVVVTAASILIFLVGWEVMSIAAYLLILADGSEDSRKAGLMYLVMTQLGFVAIASGMLVLSGGQPFASWTEVAAHAATLESGARTAAFLLLFMGFGSKAGLVPLHQWLPYAHPQAPSHVSALLSGVMLKIALFGFLEMILVMGGTSAPLGVTVLLIGLISAFFGALHAAIEHDAKRLLAWSSIENMGLIFSAVGAALALGALPLFDLSTPLIAGVLLFALIHTVNHFLFKTSLFLAVGAVVSETHTRDLDALGGLAQKWPFFSGVVLALALAAGALPPFGTFFGEWTYLQTLALGFSAPLPVAAVAVVVLGVLGLVAGLALFAFAKLFGSTFLGRARTDAALHVAPLPKLLVVPPALGAAALILTGPFLIPLLARALVAPDATANSVSIAVGMAVNPTGVVGLLALAVALVWLARYVLRPELSVRTTGIWDCGTPLTPRMEQTATGFGASIRFFFRGVVLANQKLIATPVVATNPWIATKELVWSVGSFWERRAYEPLVALVFRLSRRTRTLQSGVVQVYLLLMFIALAVAITLSL